MAKSDLDNPSSSRSLARPAGSPYKPSSITHRDYEPEPPLAPFALKPMALRGYRANWIGNFPVSMALARSRQLCSRLAT